MTLDFYELKEQPFGASPDARFLYMSATHRQAFASLLRALQANRGIVTLMSQPGLGKTTLLFHTLKSFGDKVATVYLFQAAQTPADLLRAILTDLGVRALEENADGMLLQLREVLSEEHRLGKRVIVVIDEAQNLDVSVFDLLCELSNLETPRGRLIQFILCGQPVLSDKLAALKPIQAMQRGVSAAHLEPFSAQDTAQYVDHRLRTAGYGRQSPLFTPEAAGLVARYSQGCPRIINSLCFEALSVACRDRREQIGADTVREAATTLDLAKPKPEYIFVRPVAVKVAPPVVFKEAVLPVRPTLKATPGLAPKAEFVAAPAVVPAPLPQIAAEQITVPAPVAEFVAATPVELAPLPVVAAQEIAVPVAAAEFVAVPPVQPGLPPQVAAQEIAVPASVAEFVAVPPAQPTPLPQIAAEQITVPAPAPAPLVARPPIAMGGPKVVPARFVPAVPLQAPPLKAAIDRKVIPLRPPQQDASPSMAPRRGLAIRSLVSLPLPLLTISAVLFLAVIGAIFGVYRIGTSHPAARQTVATAPLVLPSAVVVALKPQAAHVVTPPETRVALTPFRSGHDLKGMDLQSALRALSAKTHREPKDQTR